MKISLEHIAKLANVSKSTVSRALADSPSVSITTKERIKQIAQEHSYQPDSLARAFATRRSGIIGFCLYNRRKPFFNHTFYGPVLDSIIEEAGKSDYHLILSSTDSQEHTFDENFSRYSLDGVILSSFTPAQSIMEFKKRRIPLVLINDVCTTQNNAFIVDDNYGGASKLMDYLIKEKGHRKIAFFTDSLYHVSYFVRYLAYLDAHTKYNMPIYNNPAFVIDKSQTNPSPSILESLKVYNLSLNTLGSTPIITGTDIEHLIDRMLASGNIPTAILATTDDLALRVMLHLRKRGIKIPEDIAVTGYDDIAACEYVRPALTTVRVDRDAIGKLAVKELLTQIAKPETDSRIIVVDNELIIREST